METNAGPEKRSTQLAIRPKDTSIGDNTKLASPAPKTKANFYSLPRELRDAIYAPFVAAEKPCIVIPERPGYENPARLWVQKWNRFGTPPSSIKALLLTSRAVKREAWEEFCRQSTLALMFWKVSTNVGTIELETLKFARSPRGILALDTVRSLVLAVDLYHVKQRGDPAVEMLYRTIGEASMPNLRRLELLMESHFPYYALPSIRKASRLESMLCHLKRKVTGLVVVRWIGGSTSSAKKLVLAVATKLVDLNLGDQKWQWDAGTRDLRIFDQAGEMRAMCVIENRL